MQARILATIGLTLALAPAASAATTSSWDAGTMTVTLTNDGDGESFAVKLTRGDAGPPRSEGRRGGSTHGLRL
jgi:hypothetical protein